MCGRYDLNQPPGVMARHFRLEGEPHLQPRYNIAPSQLAPVVRLAGDGTRECAVLRWGLIPSWAKDAKIGYRTINARAETVATAPAFRAAFLLRRCIVPATGFYEWKALAHGTQPWRIRPADAPLFGFAGLWERWHAPDGTDLESYTIITIDANAALRALHERMPVILAPRDYGRWLDPAEAAAGDLLRPCPPEGLALYPVSARVSNPRNDDPALIEPVPEEH